MFNINICHNIEFLFYTKLSYVRGDEEGKALLKVSYVFNTYFNILFAGYGQDDTNWHRNDYQLGYTNYQLFRNPYG